MNRKLFFVFLFLVLVFSLTTTTGRAAPDDPPAESNVLNIARWYDISMLDPALAYDSASAEVIANLYSTLITLNPADPAIVNPALATGWNVSADGKTYTFTIRRGVAFHDGTLLAPSDVAYSLQRGLLQSDPGSPQWIFIRAIMGYSWGDITQEIAGGAYVGDPEGLIANADPAELLATCQKVKERVQANDAAGTVTVTLDAANGSFLSALATFGYVLNGDWAKAQMDWDGDCATWQYHYAPSYTTGSKLADKANGSGGFKLVSWTPDENLILQRHAAYWRPRPQAAVPLEEVHIRVVNSAEIPALLQSGQADIGSIPPNDEAAMDALVLLEYQSGNPVPILRHSSGVLTKLSGIPTPTASSDVALTFDIDTAGPRNYIGSGQFDGNGIPPAFFSDIHVRKAFAYAFDYNTLNADIYGGEGIRRTGPIIKPLMGYKSSQSVYPYDLTQAATELAAAWGGQAAANGFKLTLAYNEGNTNRQRVAELFKAGIEAIDPKYRIDVTAIPWPDYLNDHRNGRLPLSVNSLIQDYAHPDNWVRPYLTETYAIRQRLPEPMRLAYEQQADACLLMQGPPARACYEALQTQAYNDTATIYMFQDTRTDFVRSELFGLQTARSLDGAIDYAQLWKGGTPATATIAPDTSETLSAVGASGIQMNVAFPAGSLAEPKVILARPDIDTAGRPAPDGLKPGRLAFELSDWTPATTRATDLAFAKPVEVKLTYTVGQITPLIESGLVLVHWSGSAWLPAACGDVTADPVANTLSVPVCKTGEFQLMGPTFDAKIPMIAK